MENLESKNLLVVIDVQNCFVNDFSRDIPGKIKEYLLANESKYDFVIFTKFINQPESQFVKHLGYKDCMSPPATEIVAELREFLTEDNVFEKHTYSIFRPKEILDFIKSRKVKQIFLCGLTSDGCVLASAFDAFDLGFRVNIIKELVGTCWGSKEYNDAIIQLLGYKVDPGLLE